MMKISIVSPCFNEENNIPELYARLTEVIRSLPQFNFEIVFIDNASTDSSVDAIKKICASDPKVKLIVNTRNFGHIRSPFYGILQPDADATILIASDLQDPPELIRDFVQNWQDGFKVVIAVKNKSEESPFFFAVRKAFYNSLERISDVKLIKNYTGTGLYDRRVIEILRLIDDPYPYFRGLIADLGFDKKIVYFTQPTRKRGFSKNNFYTLYDMGMLGIVNYSRVPLRLATMIGFVLSVISFVISVAYLILKLLYWDRFGLGVAPLLIGFFFLTSIHLFFIGIIGEYVGTILTQVQKRPLVVEKERVNFDS
jgi:glycosyltransferase involved in cell wall biosynthesis